MWNIYLIVYALVGFYLNYLLCGRKEVGSKLRKKHNRGAFHNNFQGFQEKFYENHIYY